MTWILESRGYITISTTLHGLLLLPPPLLPTFSCYSTTVSSTTSFASSQRNTSRSRTTASLSKRYPVSRFTNKRRSSAGPRTKTKQGFDCNARIRGRRLEAQGRDQRSQRHVEFDGEIDDRCRFDLCCSKSQGSQVGELMELIEVVIFRAPYLIEAEG